MQPAGACNVLITEHLTSHHGPVNSKYTGQEQILFNPIKPSAGRGGSRYSITATSPNTHFLFSHVNRTVLEVGLNQSVHHIFICAAAVRADVGREDVLAGGGGKTIIRSQQVPPYQPPEEDGRGLRSL